MEERRLTQGIHRRTRIYDRKRIMKNSDPDDTREYRARMNERILSAGNLEIKRFFALDTAAYRAGALPARMKELMGLVGSLVLRCNDCIFYHLDRSVAEGATRDEMIEAMNIALVIGGSIVIPHLRYAFESMDRLLEESRQA